MRLKSGTLFSGLIAVVSLAACQKGTDAEREERSRKSVASTAPASSATSQTASSIKPSATTPEPETDVRLPTAADLPKYISGIPGAGTLQALVKTSKGELTCDLFEEAAPMTVANFVGLARGLKAWEDPKTKEVKTNTPFYEGIIFHRVIPDFMIQTGDPLGVGRGGPGYKFGDEFTNGHMFDGPGYLAMANAGPSTNGSQIFITEKATPWLNNRHTIFGRCQEVDTIKEIARVPKAQGRPQRPAKNIVIEKISFRRVRS